MRARSAPAVTPGVLAAQPQPALASKRALDLAVAVLILLAFAPLFLVLWSTVRLTSPGPALFKQARVGRNGTVFTAYKFRTMVLDAEQRLAEHLERDPAARAEYTTFRKLRRDPRVTPIGGFLRRYSLDELPQLLNVIKGDMSLVGPRCYLPEELPAMGADRAVILSVMPGLTGLWQVSGRNRTTFAQRIAFDVQYVRDCSLRTDLAILLRTVWVVLVADGAF